jgi:hypothetical protein
VGNPSAAAGVGFLQEERDGLMMTMTRPPEDPGWVQKHTGVLAGGHPTDWNPKGLRERLCAQESNVPDDFTRQEIGRLIRLLDLHRPVGSDGKHGTRHTPTCGCDLR